MNHARRIKSQRGIALVLVLWVLLLLTIITASFSLMARMDRLEANTLLSGTQARMSAEAAINLAVLGLRDPDDETRMVADGRVYQTELDGVLVEVSAIDERGKLDINAADELTLANLFVGHGMDMTEAEFLPHDCCRPFHEVLDGQVFLVGDQVGLPGALARLHGEHERVHEIVDVQRVVEHLAAAKHRKPAL